MDHKTEQEAFWLGDFGEAYRERNRGNQLTARKAAFFARALKGASNVGSICEFGCNIGLNLSALASLSDFQLTGVEINPNAAAEAQDLGVADIKVASVLDDLSAYGQFDLTFTMGVLIHINPDYLTSVYQNLVNLSRRYVLVCEYYNPAPVTVPYRGHQERLFKRDFAGELMDEFGLDLVDYGFVYRRDNHAAMDDFTWFLLRKGG
ncbi:MAG: pseudaminic acid biosynthesis-associated methylase [Pseudomonadota bacterium]